jgi:DNA-directed RNA polymerase subunit RPC12/RpoP
MPWDALHAEVQREFAQLSQADPSLEERLWRAWTYNLAGKREKDRDWYARHRLSRDFQQQKHARDVLRVTLRAQEREAARLADVRRCAECGAEFTRKPCAAGFTKYCGSGCQRAAHRRLVKEKHYPSRYKPVTREPKPCVLCAASFTPKRSDARFCGAKCRRAAAVTFPPFAT